ncbi:Clp protease N-terminal domain-containing protein [Spirilliplanes yamanashiensis]|uniref:Clp R domain-containing protein n=1 Tax=Spirilliplanes yamanashiensis TaxID=42233 RepID=A0A8J3YAS5_9ACTN|nr:Clp protease N-terminal domain-containing protein [Spirilliplanes yamanashiensis]MDP9818617.1 ATP-dependent Clp protease ATP-binding subunit ClpC [Spirilliplanes yamanashiensis]GIJ05073.1 hypothetical protein Sya03_44250 [Spirilliplanes yamanashiensis]
MPKINVYLPDDLAEAVRDTGVPVSAVCQRALEQAVRRVTAIRSTVLGEADADDLAERLPLFTARAVTVLTGAVAAARGTGAAAVGTGHLLRSLVDEGGNLALEVLRAMEIEPARLAGALRDADLAEPAGGEPGLRWSTPAANALEAPVAEAAALGHNYVGCEHLLIGLAAEPDGAAGRVLRAAGADARAVRRAVAAALAGYSHLRASTGALAGYAHLRGSAASPVPAGRAGPDALLAAVRAELAPLVERIERLEART